MAWMLDPCQPLIGPLSELVITALMQAAVLVLESLIVAGGPVLKPEALPESGLTGPAP
jgi:hypothetical protein